MTTSANEIKWIFGGTKKIVEKEKVNLQFAIVHFNAISIETVFNKRTSVLRKYSEYTRMTDNDKITDFRNSDIAITINIQLIYAFFFVYILFCRHLCLVLLQFVNIPTVNSYKIDEIEQCKDCVLIIISTWKLYCFAILINVVVISTDLNQPIFNCRNAFYYKFRSERASNKCAPPQTFH